MRILWVEDEARVIETKNTLFNQFSDNITIQSHFTQAQQDLNTHLHCYDVLVLDIDLRHSNQGTEITNYLETHKTWEIDAETLLNEAGFHLFLAAFQQSFPVERISFFTGNVDPDGRSIAFKTLLASITTETEDETIEIETVLDDFKKMIPQHETSFNTVLDQALNENKPKLLDKWYQDTFNYPPADQTAGIFKERFIAARIPTPKVFDKKNPEDKQKLLDWLTQYCTSQNPEFAYLTLRRGLLDTIDALQKDENSVLYPCYDDLLDKATFLSGLSWLLQPHHYCPKNPEDCPKNPEETLYLYLALCEHLSKPFDKLVLPKPLKYFRNWMAHGNIRQSKLSIIKPQTVGLLFILCIRELFKNLQVNAEMQPIINWLTPDDAQISNNTPNVLTNEEIKNYNSSYIYPTLKPNELNKINLIKLFYNACLNEFSHDHPLYHALQAEFQAEAEHQI